MTKGLKSIINNSTEAILCGDMRNYRIIYDLNGENREEIIAISDTSQLTKEEIEESVVFELKKRIGYHSSRDKIKVHSVYLV